MISAVRRRILAFTLLAIPLTATARHQPLSEVKALVESAQLELAGTGSGIIAFNNTLLPLGGGQTTLSAALRGGTTSGAITVSVGGLYYAPGAYDVSAILASSGNTVALGTLHVIQTVLTPPPVGPGGITPQYIAIIDSGSSVFGNGGTPFPEGFDPFDVATIVVSSSSGATISTAALTPVSTGNMHALSPLIAGAAAPGACGYALLRANTPVIVQPVIGTAPTVPGANTATPLKTAATTALRPITGKIVIHAKGLPKNTTVSYDADGTPFGTATTDAAGNLNIYAAQGAFRRLPATLDLFAVQCITIRDGTGAFLAGAQF